MSSSKTEYRISWNLIDSVFLLFSKKIKGILLPPNLKWYRKTGVVFWFRGQKLINDKSHIEVYFYFLLVEELYCELNYHKQKKNQFAI